MIETSLSSKYQIMIPKDVRRKLHLKSGQKMTCIAKNGIIRLIPQRPLPSLRGMAEAISTTGLREKSK